MTHRDSVMLMGLGGFFILLGILAIVWGSKEEKSYYEHLSKRTDIREYLNHWPQRPEPGASKVGGWIAIAAGVVLIAIGSVPWFLS